MKNAKLFRVFVTVVGIASAGCYEANAVRIPVRSPTTTLGCGELADQVFFDAGYMKLTASTGAMVYSPRGPTAAQAPLPFQWGMGVWQPHPETASDPRGGPCEYELQAVSADPSCDVQSPPGPPAPLWVNGVGSRDPTGRSSVIQCPLTPQPGAQYDEATRQMAQRLRSAGATAVSMSRPANAE
jgi:hypothetical protein